jgi:hypothetical protein
MTRTTRLFELIHCDLWTSPILSISNFKYFLIILDDFTHFWWTIPLCQKSDAYVALASFHTFAHTQFNLPLASIQCDNSREFNNAKLHTLTATYIIHIRFLCPYTSQKTAKLSILYVQSITLCVIFYFRLVYRPVFGTKLFISPWTSDTLQTYL